MIVVVGGAGYIGSVVVEDLVSRGYEVGVVDDLSLGHRSAVSDAAHWFEGDMADGSLIERVAGEFDVECVMHFAALAKVGESMRRPQKYWDQNVVSSVRMFRRWIEQGVDRFIFSSSAAVYGSPEEIPISEEHPKNPINPYGRTKRSVEWYLQDLFEAEGVRSVSLRYFNAAGAGDSVGEDHDPETHLIPIALEVAMGQREKLELFGTDYPTRDGTCVRDFVHVKDLSRAHIRAYESIKNEELGCESVNLGTETGVTVREVAQTVQAVTGREFPVEEAERRPGDPARLVASNRKAKKLLDWEPEHDLEAIVEDAWEWMQEHPEGYEAV